MAVFVPSYQHDVFISYAHVDNEPAPGAQDGWVSTLVKGLRLLLARKLGRADCFSLWMDYRLPANTPITPELVQTIEQSAALVLILSPGYLASEWCQRERNAFLQMTKQRDGAGMRVFVVEMDRIEDDERPHEIKDLLGYRFWIQEPENRSPRILGMPAPNPNEQLYYDKLNDLAHDLAEELKRLRDTASTTSATPPTPSRPAVFLADVTDDLLIQQDEVKRYLDQMGILVLPETPLYFTAPQDLQKIIDDNMQRCRLFVQLLSELPGRSLPGQPSCCHLQYKRARLAGKPIMQWRRPDLDPAKISDPDQRNLLEGDSVLAVGLEEFKREIIARAVPKPSAKKVMQPKGALVFLNTSAEDRQMAENLAQMIKEMGAGYALPITKGKPSEIRKDLEQWFLECDGVLIFYVRVSVGWAREQLRYCRKIMHRREQPLKALAVYEGPHKSGEELGVQLPGMITMYSDNGLDKSQFEPFLRALSEGNDP